MGRIRNASKMLVTTPERKRRVGKWEYKIKVGWVGVDLSPVPHGRDQLRVVMDCERRPRVW